MAGDFLLKKFALFCRLDQELFPLGGRQGGDGRGHGGGRHVGQGGNASVHTPVDEIPVVIPIDGAALSGSAPRRYERHLCPCVILQFKRKNFPALQIRNQ